MVIERDDDFVRQCIREAYCKSDAVKRLRLPLNGTGFRIYDALVNRLQIDISHYDRSQKQRRYLSITKSCPVCGEPFTTNQGQKGEKTTCSVRCSNTHFRSGDSNGSHMKKVRLIANGEKKERYSNVCWQYHDRKCIVCSETRIVEAHHYNVIHTDDRPENFAPLCPTHHQYWHSRHRHLIQERVDAYVQDFVKTSDMGRWRPATFG